MAVLEILLLGVGDTNHPPLLIKLPKLVATFLHTEYVTAVFEIVHLGLQIFMIVLYTFKM